MSNPCTINNSVRCTYRFPNGMRCRLLAFAGQPFCPEHVPAASAAPPEDTAAVAATLTHDLDDLTSADDISTFLSRLLLLTAQGKISPRRAAVLTYIASQLLHCVRTMIAEEKHSPNTEPIFDAPRPDRNCPERPESCRREPDPTASTADSSSTSTFTLPLDPAKKDPK